MCGKDKYFDSYPLVGLGSPPHVRERRRYWLLPRRYGRITPACAGKTLQYVGVSEAERDHPRMCGKDLIEQAASSLKAGSPPHVRERHTVVWIRHMDSRITPACAGKTPAISCPF